MAPPCRGAPPWMRRSSPSTSTPGPEGRQPGRDAGDPVGFLVPELARATDRGRATRPGGGQAQDRDLVDRAGHLGRPEVDGVELRGTDDEVGHRLADVGVAAGATWALVDVGAHRPQDVDDRAAGRVDPDVAQGQLGIGMDGGSDQPEGGGEMSRRNALVDRLHRHPSFHRPGHPSVVRRGPLHRDPASPEHAFRVVTRRDPFPDRRPALGPHTGQQDGRLHLRRRHRRP